MAALAVVLSMGVTFAQNGNRKGKNQVQNPEGKQPGVCLYQNCPNFVDLNNDGICDNFENGISIGKNCTGTGIPKKDGSGKTKK